MRDLLGETGIRFIRDQIDEVDSRRQTDWWDKYGIRAVLFPQAFKNVGQGRAPDPTKLPGLLNILKNDYGLNRVIATMGFNEWDKAIDSTGAKKRRSMWVPEWQLQQQALYDAVKADPALSALPVIMGPLANSGNIEFLGDVSGMVDIGNDHPYPSADGLPGQDRSGPEPQDVNTAINRIRAVAGAEVPI